MSGLSHQLHLVESLLLLEDARLLLDEVGLLEDNPILLAAVQSLLRVAA